MVADSTTRIDNVSVNEVLDGDDIKSIQDLARRVPVPPHVIHYTLDLLGRQGLKRKREFLILSKIC